MQAREFFFRCLNAQAPYVGGGESLADGTGQSPQTIMFYSAVFGSVSRIPKKTLYWTKNLPPLMADAHQKGTFKQYVHASRGKYRSRTFPKVADAIARQWGNWCAAELGINMPG